MWFELINGINGVKSLSAVNTTHLIDFDIPFTSPFGVESLPIFPNMNRLELKGFWHSGLIPQFLESCPELKHLCIEKVVDRCMKKHEEYSWVKPEVVPACVVTKLTTIKFSMCERSECDPAFLKHLLWKCDLPVLKYMLQNAEMLKLVTITWENSSIEKETLSCAMLLKLLPRASRYCEIYFQ
ncbi:hypothetical protein HanXRQr2_Chr17g0823531 [Helianthus annuus]|uniref:Uncharacterized protein n=2 Tax=Helianthus annuus TaxID=4232 RepID=A0A9K3DMW0_HELAN|nr:F-box/FBD/LRR-repeat protein At1g78750 [Helianthus annuus]KAF5757178.1 hypothetical protein HanXRQr2_Chr17g0823531 [Helianthus annuus]KAJ0435491.1 hypothetical protein HanIR_Chr17g0893871 [Helianthus annuus]KAJ0637693.1 hypothetical protein HanOQP8_Chr17g0676761 [Helianthus annuus]